MFMGEYSHGIDEKGRLIMPAKYREALHGEFVVTKGMDGCLSVYPIEEWKKLEENFGEATLTGKDARKFVRFVFSNASLVEIDKQGRFLLPANLREYAGLKKDVVLVGVLNRIEIWDKDAWEENSSYDDMDEIADKMAELGIGI